MQLKGLFSCTESWKSLPFLSAAVTLQSQIQLTWNSLRTGSHCLQCEDWLAKTACYFCMRQIFSYQAGHPEIQDLFFFSGRMLPCFCERKQQPLQQELNEKIPKNQWYCVVQIKIMILWQTVKYWAYLISRYYYISKFTTIIFLMHAIFWITMWTDFFFVRNFRIETPK